MSVKSISKSKQNVVLRTVIKYPILPTLAFFLVMVTVFICLSPINKLGQNIFLSPQNLSNIAEATAAFSIGAFAMTLVLLVGCIDLSVESVISLSAVSLALYIEAGLPLPLAILCTLAIGIVCGATNSMLVVKFKVPPFLATISVAMAYTGLSYLLSDSRTIITREPMLTRIFGSLGSGASFLGLPVLFVWTLLILAGMYTLISRSKFGRWAQATGGNEQAAYSSGVNTRFVRMVAYMLMGFFGSLIGVILCARLSVGSPALGNGYGLNLVMAAVLGGTSFAGEGGNVFGALLGSLVIGVLQNGLGIIGVNVYVQQVITGMVIVSAVVFSIYISSRK